MVVEKLCREEEVGFVGKFCWNDGYVHGLSAAVDSAMGSISNIFGSKHYLN